MPTFDCTLFAANNASNGGVNTLIELYSYDAETLIGSGNSINTFTSIGALVAYTPYLINITFGAAIALSNTWFTEMYFAQTLNATDFFAGGLEISPSLPSGVTNAPQLYGNQYFDFAGFTTVAGQQYTLCFADVALQSGTLNVVLSNFGATNIFTAYSQAFVANNSLIVVLQANTSATCPANAQVQVSIASVGTTVRQNVAPILNASVFASVIPQMQQARAAVASATQAKVSAIRAIRNKAAAPAIMPPPSIIVADTMQMSEDEEYFQARPDRKHKRIY
jgi:hypothetical protein